MRNNKSIGIFDSGVGGLSIWEELIKKFPNENVIYYADSANCPYGPKSKDEIVNLTSNITDFLISKECKIIIVACNTATAAAIDYLRESYNIPFIGMEPAIKPASLNSQTKSIGVLATEGTFNGRLYLETSQRFASDVKLNVKVGDKLVDIVENGLVHKASTKLYLSELISPLIKQDIDHLVLGCTHYPFLTPVLKSILPKHVKIVNPASAVVKQAGRILQENNLLNPRQEKPIYEFYTTGKKGILHKFLNQILEKPSIVQKL
jgi:glutamate racemase